MTHSDWLTGNAVEDGHDRRGWIIGSFVKAEDIRHSTNVEVKWGVHPAGEQRHAWLDSEQRTTFLILVSGRFRIDLSAGSQTLARPGDYAMWGPGVGHSWQAEADSTVITIRWTAPPSKTQLSINP
jgi:mannose-6-phosphate isomerase-like protein (cupin superfamily)